MKSVAIVAMSGTGFLYHLAFERNSAKPADEVWGINSAGVWYRQVDKIIALDDLKRDLDTHPDYVKAIVECGLPVITTQHYPEWPTTEAYPLAEVVRTVFRGDVLLAQFTLQNTICYATALGIARKAKRISLYGIDFANRDDPRLLADAWPGRRVPSWFKYHDRAVVLNRVNTEPGNEGMGVLFGIGNERGVEFEIPEGSTLLDRDREPYFYGYEEQPEI